MPEETLFEGFDHLKRWWKITARPSRVRPGSNQIDATNPVAIVTFTCWNSSGRSKALDRTAAWLTEGWDMLRPWFPASPRPVPERILKAVEKTLQEMV